MLLSGNGGRRRGGRGEEQTEEELRDEENCLEELAPGRGTQQPAIKVAAPFCLWQGTATHTLFPAQEFLVGDSAVQALLRGRGKALVGD